MLKNKLKGTHYAPVLKFIRDVVRVDLNFAVDFVFTGLIISTPVGLLVGDDLSEEDIRRIFTGVDNHLRQVEVL